LSSRRTTINPVPIYEFECRDCGHRFEELVGSHVGTEADDVACPECGSAEVERLLSTSYAPLHRQLTPNQRRKLEEKRGTNRDGAMERFRKQRAAERAARRRGDS
jgi:putative FmdB family regulatory protein